MFQGWPLPAGCVSRLETHNNRQQPFILVVVSDFPQSNRLARARVCRQSLSSRSSFYQPRKWISMYIYISTRLMNKSLPTFLPSPPWLAPSPRQNRCYCCCCCDLFIVFLRFIATAAAAIVYKQSSRRFDARADDAVKNASK